MSDNVNDDDRKKTNKQKIPNIQRQPVDTTVLEKDVSKGDMNNKKVKNQSNGKVKKKKSLRPLGLVYLISKLL